MTAAPMIRHATLRGFARIALRLLLGVACSLGGAAAVGSASAADLIIDSITVKWREGVLAEGSSTPTDSIHAALDAALQGSTMPAGRTRDGAIRLGLSQPLRIEEARAAVNRARMLPQVLYAQINEPAAVSAGNTAVVSNAAVQQPAIARMIVKYRDAGLSAAAARNETLAAAQLDELTAKLGRPVSHERAMSGGAWVVRLFQALPADQTRALAQLLETDPAVEYAEPDMLMQPMLAPNDTSFASSQWDLKAPSAAIGGANLPPAWDITTGSAGIVVAVIDTGILPHPDLKGRYLAGYDMIGDALIANDGNGRDSDPTDRGDWITSAESSGAAAGGYFRGCPTGNSSWHGTHVSGTIGATTNNGAGIAGINWVSMILPVRVLGKCGGYTSDIADAMVWAAGLPVAGVPANPNPARVLNLSLGGSGSCGSTFQKAINAALGVNAVVAVAAGNSNADASGFSPANCAGVITVAATQGAGARASYSNYGTAVEIAAPGGGDGNYILSTLNHGTTVPDLSSNGWYYEYYQGTSMATPHVAGIVSLMLSANPTLTPAQVLARVQTTARAFPTGTGRDCTTALCGAGIIDAGAAVAAVVVPASTGPAGTTTTLASSANPAAAGATITWTATVNGAAPTGTVSFRNSGAPISGCAGVPVVGTGNARTVACSVSALAVGIHSIVASYGGDTGNAASTSGALSQVINGAAGTTTLASSANPATTGANVTFTATVTGSAPTGTVNFTAGGTPLSGCGTVAVAGLGNSRTAACSTRALAAGNHNIVASYGGDGGNVASASAPLSQGIIAAAPAATTTRVSSSRNPVSAGASVTFTATVTGSVPTGVVNFTDGVTSIGGCDAVAITGSGNSRTAACSTHGLAVGLHNIVGSYGGDAANGASSSAPLLQFTR